MDASDLGKKAFVVKPETIKSARLSKKKNAQANGAAGKRIGKEPNA